MTVPARACLGGLRPSFGEPPGAPPLPPPLSCPARRPPPLTAHLRITLRLSCTLPAPSHSAAGTGYARRPGPARRPAPPPSALLHGARRAGPWWDCIGPARPPPYNLSSPPAPPAPHPPQLGLHRRLDLPAARRGAALPPKQTVFVGARLGAGAARQAAPPRTGCPNGRVRLYRRPTRAVYHVQEQ